jgi:hypothetical protein
MKNIILIIGLTFATGCASSPTPEVVESMEVLRDNTLTLSQRYTALLKRSGPDEGQDEKKWSSSVKRDTMLMEANNMLANKMLEWASVASGEKEGDK